MPLTNHKRSFAFINEGDGAFDTTISTPESWEIHIAFATVCKRCNRYPLDRVSNVSTKSLRTNLASQEIRGFEEDLENFCIHC